MNKNGLLIVGMFLGGIALMSDPRCTHSCRTLGQHLIDHGIDDFVSGLLTALFR